MADWDDWTPCSADCDSGFKTRERTIIQNPAFGGEGCEGGVGVMEPCGSENCPPDEDIQDCKWGDWADWGACTKCGGQRIRTRHILSHAKNGGAPCEQGAAQEAGACPRKCHEKLYCTWQPWSDWSKCDAHCGEGTRERVRKLAQTTKEGEATMDYLGRAGVVQQPRGISDLDNDALRRSTAAKESAYYRSLVVYFACGGGCIMACLLRTLDRTKACDNSV